MSEVEKTTINGYESKLWSHSDSQPVRQFVAEVGRGHPGIGRVGTTPVADVKVWVQTAPDVDDAASIFTPEGWTVEKVQVTKGGGVAVYYNQVER